MQAPTTAPPTTGAPTAAPTACVECQVAGLVQLTGIAELDLTALTAIRNLIIGAAAGACGGSDCSSADVTLGELSRRTAHRREAVRGPLAHSQRCCLVCLPCSL